VNKTSVSISVSSPRRGNIRRLIPIEYSCLAWKCSKHSLFFKAFHLYDVCNIQPEFSEVGSVADYSEAAANDRQPTQQTHGDHAWRPEGQLQSRRCPLICHPGRWLATKPDSIISSDAIFVQDKGGKIYDTSNPKEPTLLYNYALYEVGDLKEKGFAFSRDGNNK
jgi:hypothetical protein